MLLGMTGQNSFARWPLGRGCVHHRQRGHEVGLPAHRRAYRERGLGTGFFAFLLGFAFFRLVEYYFTFASVGLMTILNGLFMNWTSLPGRAIANVPPFSIGNFVVKTEKANYYFIFPDSGHRLHSH